MVPNQWPCPGVYMTARSGAIASYTAYRAIRGDGARVEVGEAHVIGERTELND